VILVTRLNWSAFALNPDLIERADATPDTVVTLVDGTKYVISESVTDFIELVRQYRASVIAEAHRQVDAAPETRRRGVPRAAAEEEPAKVVQLHPRER
jgi:flagellar protein FlbD